VVIAKVASYAALGAALLVATPAAAQTLPRVWLPGYRDPVAFDTLGNRQVVQAAPGAVYGAAAAVLEKAGIDITYRDSLRGVVGNPAVEKRRRIAKSPLSRFLNCGNGFSGPNADSWGVTMAVLVSARASDGGTALRVGVAAGARDLSGPSKDPVTCGSTGALEELIATEIRNGLGA
jgi:hypothetical protein